LNTRFSKLGIIAALVTLVGWSQYAYAQSEDVVVVLSSESGPYQEALAGFRESFSHPFTTFVLSKGDPGIPKSTRLIVAIGGKAAIYGYKDGNIPLVYCVAPGIYVNRDLHPGPEIKVYVSPQPSILLQKLQELQPNLRRLGSIWVDYSFANYGGDMKKVAEQSGITVQVEHLKSLDDLPDLLRAMKGHVDAFWIPPDPLLITPESFSAMRQFALDNMIPLYVSIDGLADKGAAASVSVSFRDMGRKAGSLAAQALSGSADNLGPAFGDHVSVTINASVASQSGLTIDSGVLKKADRVIP
jgi:putative ABC transport system substrate-binding protein